MKLQLAEALRQRAHLLHRPRGRIKLLSPNTLSASMTRGHRGCSAALPVASRMFLAQRFPTRAGAYCWWRSYGEGLKLCGVHAALFEGKVSLARQQVLLKPLAILFGPCVRENDRILAFIHDRVAQILARSYPYPGLPATKVRWCCNSLKADMDAFDLGLCSLQAQGRAALPSS